MRPRVWNPGRRGRVLLALLVALSLTWIGFGRSIRDWLSVQLLLHSDRPGEEFFVSTFQRSTDPATLLRKCWAKGKIVHREWVARCLSGQAAVNPPWLRGMDDVLAAGALDADMSVRELVLATLDLLRSPRLFELAQAQLTDRDPLIRLLGLQYLRRIHSEQAVPVLMNAIDDPDLRVAAEAEVALMRWSGVDFGVRVKMTIPAQVGPDAGVIEANNVAAIRNGLARRREWWQGQANGFVPLSNHTVGRFADPEPPRWIAAPDFDLRALDGKKFKLSHFRGRPVLINFWATWCTACVAEIPELIALQQELGDRVTILGVVLDGVPDEHGLPGGEESAEDGGKPAQAFQTILEKVARTVRSRGINYTVLWDANGLVAGSFNGGELPTTVLIDKDGLVRRRFVGERSRKVFESMVAEISPSGRR
jgi:cytochrome c biogenesis protein CcmG, thiol:disulfide interchange protein DsbE